MDKMKEFEKRIEGEKNHFKKIKMTVALDKIKKDLEKNEK